MIEKLLHIRRINIIGVGLGVIGLSIILTQIGSPLSVVTFIYREYGIHPAILGGLMSAGGWIVLFLDTRLLVFIGCTLPWTFYMIAAFLFIGSRNLSATAGLAYLLISALIFREALERPV